jgi:hypothetical protein
MATGAGTDGIFMSGAFALDEAGAVEGQWGHTHFEATLPATTTCLGGGIRDDSIFARITVDGTTGTLTEECRHEVTAGNSNGIDITTRVAGGFAMSGFVMLLRNGDKRFWADVPAVATSSTGDKTVTIGWEPGAIFGVPTGKTTLNGYESSGATCGTFGEATNDGQGGQKVAAVAVEDDVPTSDSYNTIANNWNVLNVAAGNDWVGSVTARTATGFTFNISNASSADAFTGFFAVEASKAPAWSARGGPGAAAQARSRESKAVPHTKAASRGTGALLRAMTRWRLDRLARWRRKPEALIPEDEAPPTSRESVLKGRIAAPGLVRGRVVEGGL